MAQDNTSETLLSFVITYHNEPVEMLAECIESIRHLCLREYEREIIIVDDGSDKSPINEMPDHEAHLLYIYQKGQGVSMARNRGLTMASGRYIQFVDADDCLVTEDYNHCISLIRDDVDMIAFDYTKRPSSSHQSYHDTTYQSGTSLMHNHNIKGSACLYLFRKDAAPLLHFTEGIDYAEDEEFTTRLLLKVEKVVTTDAKAYFYRQHDSSATHDDNRVEKRLQDTLRVILRLHGDLDRLPKNEQAALQRRVAQLTMDYLYNIIMLTHSRQQLDTAIADLQSEGLFPLPKKNYSTKYKWFRRIVSTSVGRTFLLNTLPHFKRES